MNSRKEAETFNEVKIIDFALNLDNQDIEES